MIQCSQSIIYNFEDVKDASKWGTITTEETNSNVQASALKINPNQRVTIFVEKDSVESSGKVRFKFNKHGNNPSIFELIFLIDNEPKNLNDNKDTEWIQTDNFQTNYNTSHNLTWCFKLKDNWREMRKAFWDSSCWVDDVELTGLEIIDKPIIPSVKDVSIEPKEGDLNQMYRYLVNFNGLDEIDFNSIQLEISDYPEMEHSQLKYPIFCNKSHCVFEINGFPFIDSYLGRINYKIIYKNLLLREGNGPNITINIASTKRECHENGLCDYTASVRSTICPTNFTLCYGDVGIWEKAITQKYNSCGDWKSFTWINQRPYKSTKVVNDCDCN